MGMFGSQHSATNSRWHGHDNVSGWYNEITLRMLPFESWLVWFSGLVVILQTKRSPVRSPVRVHAWVVGQIPIWGHWYFFPTFSPSLPLSLKINKIFLNLKNNSASLWEKDFRENFSLFSWYIFLLFLHLNVLTLHVYYYYYYYFKMAIGIIW